MWRWRLAGWLAALHLRGDVRFRELVVLHITLAFPDATVQERLDLIRLHATEHFFALLDRFRLWQIDAEAVADTVQLDGLVHLRAHMGQHPIVLLCPHFVGLEAMAQRLALEGPMMTLYRPAANASFESVRTRARGRFHPQHLVPVGAPLFGLIKRLRGGTPLFLLPDVDVGARGAVFSPFLGAVASTSVMGAWAVAHTGAKVMPVSVRHVGAGRYAASIGAPLSDLPSGSQQLTDRLNAEMERLVRAHPAHYWWTNVRFASRPTGAAPLYSPAVLRSLGAALLKD
jgi:Kdo2-lipid IVA lauroyltransferase/acyltransferase